jgi:hypothetical protein
MGSGQGGIRSERKGDKRLGNKMPKRRRATHAQGELIPSPLSDLDSSRELFSDFDRPSTFVSLCSCPHSISPRPFNCAARSRKSVDRPEHSKGKPHPSVSELSLALGPFSPPADTPSGGPRGRSFRGNEEEEEEAGGVGRRGDCARGR